MNNIFTVIGLNKYIKNMIDKDVVLQNIAVKGEISNIKYHSSGHIYLTLKDNKSNINVIMFRSYVNNLKCKFINGDEVIILGYISVYEANGNYQLYAENIEPMGIGALSKKFEDLKLKLSKKGYFDKEYKKELPEEISTVAVLTSKTGAAIHDIIQTIQRRNQNIKIVVIPTIVQGDASATDICKNLDMVERWGKADIIILGRGGGSIEDLWPFNEEIVANKIFELNTPIISAVGHDTDYTISDFVADIRVSTPTAAGELVSKETSIIKTELTILITKLRRLIIEQFNKNFNNLETLNISKYLNLNQYINNLIIYNKQMLRNTEQQIIYYQKDLDNKIKLINNGNPLNNLTKGYAIAYKNNKNIKSINELSNDDNLKIELVDGYIDCKVDATHKKE